MIIVIVQLLFGLCCVLLLGAIGKAMAASGRTQWFDIIAGVIVPPYAWVLASNVFCLRFGLGFGVRVLLIAIVSVVLFMSISVALGLGMKYVSIRWFAAVLWFWVPAAFVYGKSVAKHNDSGDPQ